MMDTKPNVLLCFGLGYCAMAVAERLISQEWRIMGTSRSAVKRASLAAQGYHPFGLDDATPLDPALLAEATHILISIPPDHYGDLLIARCSALLKQYRPRWIGYLSTVGVYGDRDGGWVDEATMPVPQAARSRARLTAENAWQTLGRDLGITVDIFRLGGIYGEGRSPFDAIRAGTAQRIDKPGQFFNRIHRDDIAAMIEAAIQFHRREGGPDQMYTGQIYNLVDDLPAAPAAVIEYACDLLRVAYPPLVPIEAAKFSTMALSFYQENKRVSNRITKDLLDYTLQYPTYREGLAALLKIEKKAAALQARVKVS